MLDLTVTKVFPTGSSGTYQVGIHLVLTDDDRADLGAGEQTVIDRPFRINHAKGTEVTAAEKTEVGNLAQDAIDTYKSQREMFVSAAYNTARDQIAAALTIAPLFNTLFALGEELGWRGYLLPKLLPLGQIPAMLISGAIWGIWHAPALLQGHNYPDHPVLGVGMMIVFTVLLGIFFSWLYLKTKSPWTPALAHGTVNAVAGLPLLFLKDVNLTLGGSITSVSGWLALAALVGILYWKREIPLR